MITRAKSPPARGEHISMPASTEPADSPKTVTDRKSTRLNSSHLGISYAVFCLKKKTHLSLAGRSQQIFTAAGTVSTGCRPCGACPACPLCRRGAAAVVSTLVVFFFFFNDTATTEIYTLSLHDALPISLPLGGACRHTPLQDLR